MEEENGIADSVGVIDPTQSVRMGKQKAVSVSGPAVSKGYKVKTVNATNVPKTAVDTSSQQAKDFIVQSKALDHELDYAIGLIDLMIKDNDSEDSEDSDDTNIDQNDEYDLLLVIKKISNHITTTLMPVT